MFSQKSEIERLRKRVEVLEAKVDNLMRNAGYDVDKPAVEASSEVKELLIAGDRIAAIKVYRRETGASLKDAKEYIDSLHSQDL